MLCSLKSISLYRQRLEDAYLFQNVHASTLLTMSQTLDKMIVDAQRIRRARFVRLDMRAARRRVSRVPL